MITPSTWTTIELDVITEIYLDSKNIRLENTDDRLQADIITDLFDNEKALELVEAICKVGYLGHERPVVLVRDGKYIAVEGNRRIAALKAIQNPLLVPSFSSRIQKHVENHPNPASLRSVEVIIAPTQEDANQLIAALHTGTPREAWGPTRQAAFFQSQIDEGKTLKELVERYPLLKVKDFVFQAKFFNKFRETNFADPKLKDFFNTTRGKKSVSTVKRIYLNKDFREMLNLRMDEAGEITADVSDKTFEKIIIFIAQGLESSQYNTRTLNSKKDFLNFNQQIAEIISLGERGQTTIAKGGAAPKTPSTTSPSAPSSVSPNIDKSNIIQNPAPSNTNPIRRQPSAPHKTLDYPQIPASYPVALKKLYDEFQNLNLSANPNIAYLCIRSILEKSIKSFAKQNNRIIKNELNNPKKSVQLFDCLTWLVDKYDGDDISDIKPSIKLLRGDDKAMRNFPNSLEAMNGASHNSSFLVTSEEAITLWDKSHPVIEYLFDIKEKEKS